jgi:hypothetical protein
MKRWLAALVVSLGMASPAFASDHGPRTAPAGPLSTCAAADAEATPRPAPAEVPLVRARLPPTSGRRPPALPALYVSLTALNALDVYSTNRALRGGARELNPVMAPAGGSYAAALAIKAATTTSSIVLAERLWKKNRAAAIVTMAAVNGVTAVIVARNWRNAR